MMGAGPPTTVRDTLEEVRAAGVELWFEGERLRFKAPPGALTDAMRERLRAGKDAVLEALRAEAAADVEWLPIAANQGGLWFLHQLMPESSAYNVGFAVRVHGDLDTAALRRTLQVLVDRHEALRTGFGEADGEPRRIVTGYQPVGLDVVDAGSWSPDELGRAVDLVCREPFVLDAPPLLRGRVFREAPDRHVFALAAHHLALDGQSFFIVFRELLQVYEALAGGGPVPPSEAQTQYGDFVTWQRAMLDGTPELGEYWADVLDPPPPPLGLPTDRPRRGLSEMRGGTLHGRLDARVAAGLRAIGRDAGASDFVVLLALWGLYLHRITGETDVTVGSPVLGRAASRFESTVGDFVNMIPLRMQLSPEESFRALVGAVRETVVGGMAHQDLPLPLMGAGRRTSARAGAPFQTLFVLQDFTRFGELYALMVGARDRLSVGGLELEHVPLRQQEGQFDLALDVMPSGDVLNCVLKYDGELFDESTARRRLSEFVRLAADAAARPDVPVAELDLLPDSDRALLAGWNATGRSYDREATVPALLAATASRMPDAVAVTSPTGAWSYGELLSESQRVARGLAELGVEPGDRVALLVERGREMLAGLVGVLGAGAAYVPLDPGYPEARIRYMLEDSGVAAVVARGPVGDGLGVDVPVLDLHGPLPAPGPFVATGPEESAYVIYTSGSTGKPKGVEVPHRAVANFLASMASEPGLTERDVVLAVTTVSFDIAVLELYLPLAVGARVVVAAEDDTADGRRLAELMEAEGVTLMQATPATWKLLLAGGWEGKGDLRALCGGEALPRSLADDLLERVAELWNLYGPTEATVWSTVQRIEGDEPILIGRPIANTTLHVLDDALRPAPVGVPGELWIGGDGLAKGYLGRPELTEERFRDVPDGSGERMYRTGDLVRQRPDGALEHLGRLDHQVKVRGFRIELGEVESVLRSHPGVRDAVVVARDERLVAYLVYELEAPSPGRLRAWAGESLPPYMVPAFFVPVEAFPLTPNGKVDRARLPAPGGAAPDARTFHEPTRPAEKALARVWSELLPVDRVSRSDNFFELGGHSLLAMKVVARLEDETGHRLEPRSLFFKTLGELAESFPPVP